MEQTREPLTAEQGLRDLIRDYHAVLALEIADARQTFDGDGIPLLRASVDRIEELGRVLVQNAGRIKADEAAPRPLIGEVMELVGAYAKIAWLIQEQVVDLRANLQPDTGQPVVESLRKIADLLGAMKQAEADVREAVAHG